MNGPTQVFIAAIAMGLLLLGLEIFVPGGILGVFGVLSLLVAVALGFFAFGAQGGFLAAVCIVLFSAVVLSLWIRLFPRTKIGRTLTLQKDGHEFKDAAASSTLLGKEGEAASNLQLSGIALIDGRRVDVMAESTFIPAGTRVRVVKVEGHRVIVREAPPA